MMKPENYIVSIHRRDADDPDHLMGIVQGMETGHRWAFCNVAELVQLLVGQEHQLSALQVTCKRRSTD